jgi:hypothetical protein
MIIVQKCAATLWLALLVNTLYYEAVYLIITVWAKSAFLKKNLTIKIQFVRDVKGHLKMYRVRAVENVPPQ